MQTNSTEREGKPRRKPGRPPSVSQAQFREHLLRTALDSFLANGFEAASINAIAQLSGISRDTIYRQYGSKEELFRAATAYGLERLAEHLRVAMSAKGSIEAVLLRAALQIHDDMTAPDAVPVLRLILAESHRFPDLGERMFEDARDSLAPLVDYLASQRQAGRLDLADPFEAAFMLATLAIGGVRMFLVPAATSGDKREQWVRQVVSTLLRSWEPRAARRPPAGDHALGSTRE